MCNSYCSETYLKFSLFNVGAGEKAEFLVETVLNCFKSSSVWSLFINYFAFGNEAPAEDVI